MAALAGAGPRAAYSLPPGCSPLDYDVDGVACVPGSDAMAAAAVNQTWGQALLQWMKSTAILGDIVDGLVSANDFVNSWIKTIVDETGLATAIHVLNDQLKSILKVSIQKDKKATVMAVAINQVVAKKTADRVMKEGGPAAGNISRICNTFIAYQGQIGMEEYALWVENTLTAATDALFLGPGQDGTGPAATSFYANMVECPKGNGPRSKDYPLGDSLRLYPDNCVSPDPFFNGADKHAAFLLDDSSTFEMPPIVEQEITLRDGSKKKIHVPQADESLLVADPDDDEKNVAIRQGRYRDQQAFIAAWKFCIRAMGRKPTPPTGAAMATPQGITYMHQWNHAATAQSTFMSQCHKMIARHTRPNCDTAATANICTSSMLACSAAAALGINLPFPCNRPMTKDQAQYAAIMSCSSPVAASTGKGKNDKEKEQEEADRLQKCAAALGEWRQLKVTEEIGFMKALVSLDRPNWPKGAKGGRSSSSPSSTPNSPDNEASPSWNDEGSTTNDGNPIVQEGGATQEPGDVNNTGEGLAPERTPEQTARMANIIEQLLGAPATEASNGNNAQSFATGFDCSGLVWYAAQLDGNNFERGPAQSYYDQAVSNQNGWSLVPLDQLQPGDMIAVDKTGGGSISHASYYVGPGYQDQLGQGKDLLNSPGTPGYTVRGGTVQNYVNQYGSGVYGVRHVNQ